MGKLERAIPSSKDYITLRNWFKQYGTSKKHHELMRFHFEQSVPMAQPQTIEQSLHWYFRKCKQRWKEDTLFPVLSVAVIQDGRLFGDKGVVLPPENKLIKHVSFSEILTDRDRLPKPRYTKETVAVLSFRYPNNYFHWMFDVLPRIHLLRKSGLPIDKYVISPPGGFPYLEMFQALGIPENKLIIADKDFHLKAKRLVVVDKFSKWMPYQHIYPEWASQFLREELSTHCHKQPSNKWDRIYISRSHSRGRKVRNELEVRKLLKAYGFRHLHLDSMSLEEQIHAFQSASVIVSPHGASLANLVYARPGAKLIEIFSPNYVRDYYLCIASHMKLDYYYLIGEGKRPPQAHKHTKAIYEDIAIGLNSLEKILHKAGVHKP